MDIIFTEHAEYRIKKRKITKDEIINVIKYPEKTKKIGGEYYVQKNIGRGKVEVVYEKDKYIKVVTVYWI